MSRPQFEARSLPSLAIGGLLFFFPLAHVPWSKYLRFRLLGVPQFADTYATFTPGVFLVPEFLVVLALGTMLLVEGRLRQRPGRDRGLPLLGIAAVLITTGGVIAAVGSAFPALAATGAVYRATAFLLAWLIVRAHPTIEAVRFWAYAAIGGTAVVCILGLYYFYLTFGIRGLGDFAGLRSDPRFYAYTRAAYGAGYVDALLVMTLPLTLSLALARSARRSTRLLLAIVSVLQILNLLFAFSRWAWITVVVALVLLIVYWRRSVRGIGMAGAVIVALLFFGNAVRAGVGPYFAAALEAGSGSNLLLRQQLWVEGIDAVVANPAGYGFDTLNFLSRLTYGSAHNFLIDVALEGGVMALAGAAIWVALCTGGLVRMLRDPKPANDLPFSLLLGAAGLMIFGIFSGAYMIGGAVMVWVAYWWAFPAMAFAVEDAQRTVVPPRVR